MKKLTKAQRRVLRLSLKSDNAPWSFGPRLSQTARSIRRKLCQRGYLSYESRRSEDGLWSIGWFVNEKGKRALGDIWKNLKA